MANPFAAAASRMQPRASFYKGASFDRLSADYFMWRMSADQQLRFDLQALRTRARDLTANSSTAAAIPKILSENVIGKDGIILQAEIETTRGELNKDACARIEDAWAEWCEPGNCSADGQGSFVDLQRLWLETECVDGETILYHVEGYDNKWGYAIDTIDADQLDHTYNVVGTPQTNAVRLGVEVNRWHRPVAYWMWTAHPSEPEGKSRQRVEAGRMDHIYTQIRPKATRGPTWLAPVIFDLNMLAGYRDAEITAARVAACAMGFLQQDPDAPGPMQPTDGGSAVEMQMSPASIKQLTPGQTFQGWEPQHPNTAFEKFDQAIQRGISSGLRVSYMSLTNDLSATSFASGRIGILAERAVFQAQQQRYIRRIMTPVYRRWLKMAMLSGALKLPTMQPEAYYNVVWHPRAFPWIDPSKDIDLAERSVAMGLDDLTRLAAEQGRSIEDVFKRREREIALAKKYGVPLVIAAGKAKPIDVDTVEQSEEDTDGDSGGSTKPTQGPSRNGNGKGKNGANGHHPRIPVLT